MRFRRGQHLRSQNEIRAVREHGRRLDCRAFTLLYRSPAPVAAAETETVSGPVRAGFVASRHAVGGAVQRNRAKRRLREVFRRHQTAVPAGMDLLLVARSAAGSWAFTELERTFVDACGRMSPSRHG